MMECIRKFNEEIKVLCLDGLGTDGAHHKQWYLEEILKKLGYSVKILRRLAAEKDEYLGEEGIPP